MDEQVERECPVCRVIYYADPARLKHGRQTTCSRACSYRLRASGKQNGEEHTCPVCGQVFYRTPSQIKAKHGVTTCSSECAYKVRQRVVTTPYVFTAEWDRSAASVKAWETRRREAKPYPDAARVKARAQLAKNLEKLGGVSKFEKEVAKVLDALGVPIETGVAIRRPDGTYLTVFDILIPTRRLVVECHGTYWHGGRWSWDTPDAAQAKNLIYEGRKMVLAREHGYALRVVWEHEFHKDRVGAVLTAIR